MRQKAFILGIVNLVFAVVLAVMSPTLLYFGRDAVKQVWMMESPEFYAGLGLIGLRYQRLVTSLEMMNAGAMIMVLLAFGLSVLSGIFLLRVGGRVKIQRGSAGSDYP